MQIKNRRRNQFLSLSLAIALVLVFSAGALLATSSPAAAQDRIQLQVFMMNIKTGRGNQTRHTPITVYIDTDDPKDSGYVCAIAPRIINSVFSRLRKTNLRLDKNGSLDMARITERLTPVVKRAVKRDIVVHTIFCGDEGQGREGHWESAALLAGGSFSHIDQNRLRVFIHELPGFGRPQVLDF